LREPIALAYLLARTTDTVADTTQIGGTVRIETLKILADGIQGNAPRGAIINQVAPSCRYKRMRLSERSWIPCLTVWNGWNKPGEQIATTFARA